MHVPTDIGAKVSHPPMALATPSTRAGTTLGVGEGLAMEEEEEGLEKEVEEEEEEGLEMEVEEEEDNVTPEKSARRPSPASITDSASRCSSTRPTT